MSDSTSSTTSSASNNFSTQSKFQQNDNNATNYSVTCVVKEKHPSRLVNHTDKSHTDKSKKTGSLFQKSYVLLDELGRGGYGFVYRCVNKVTKVVCAVKFNIDPSNMASMKQEYFIISDICHLHGHPNIVNVLGSISDDKIVYNMFELASGGDLFTDLDDKGYYPESVAADVFQQVLQGVDYIHSRGYLHRDIKPQNLLILKSNYLHIKITDFGLSIKRKKCQQKLDNPSDEYPTYMRWQHGYAGTDNYISPEVLKNTAYDYECDVWSCGVVLFEMLSGNYPYDDPCTETEPQFTYPEWRDMDDARDLVKQIFNRSTSYRITVNDALNHPFVTNQVLYRKIKPDMSSAMVYHIGMRKLKEEFFKLEQDAIL